MDRLPKRPEEGDKDSLKRRIVESLSSYDKNNPAKYLDISNETADRITTSMDDVPRIANNFIAAYPQALTTDAYLIETYRQILNSHCVSLESLLTIKILEPSQESDGRDILGEAIRWADELLASEMQKRGEEFLKAAGALQIEEAPEEPSTGEEKND